MIYKKYQSYNVQLLESDRKYLEDFLCDPTKQRLMMINDFKRVTKILKQSPSADLAYANSKKLFRLPQSPYGVYVLFKDAQATQIVGFRIDHWPIEESDYFKSRQKWYGQQTPTLDLNKGRWVAMYAEEIIASHHSPQELLEEVYQQYTIATEHLFLFYIE